MDRIRGRWLTNFRAAFLSRHPLCAACAAQGYVTAATEVDHIVALVNGGGDFDVDPKNAQGLCEECHDAKTALDLGHKIKPTTGLDGWPVEQNVARGGGVQSLRPPTEETARPTFCNCELQLSTEKS